MFPTQPFRRRVRGARADLVLSLLAPADDLVSHRMPCFTKKTHRSSCSEPLCLPPSVKQEAPEIFPGKFEAGKGHTSCTPEFVSSPE